MQLLLGQLDFLRGTLLIEQAGPHRDGHLIEIANLRENVVGRAPQLEVASPLGDGAPIAKRELGRSEPLCERHDFVPTSSRNAATVGKTGVDQFLVGKPQPADILDPIERNTTRHVQPLAIVLDGRDVRLDDVVEGHGYDSRLLALGSRREFSRNAPIAANKPTGCSTYGT